MPSGPRFGASPTRRRWRASQHCCAHRRRESREDWTAGFGNVGRQVACQLADDVVPEARLVAVAARDLARAAERVRALTPPPQVLPLVDLPGVCDVVVECATAESFPTIARVVLGAGRTLICVSAGGVPNCPDLLDLAQAHGGRVIVASGALPGLDIVRSAAEGTIRSVHLASRIRPESLAHEAYVLDRGHDFSVRPSDAPVLIIDGSAGEAAANFPRHFNVAISLSLAGIGFERTTVEIWADPGIPGTVHHAEVEADDVGLSMTSRNRPSENPRTSRIVAPSTLAAIRRLATPLSVGS